MATKKKKWSAKVTRTRNAIGLEEKCLVSQRIFSDLKNSLKRLRPIEAAVIALLQRRLKLAERRRKDTERAFRTGRHR